MRFLKILSRNVNGTKTKLEKWDVKSVLLIKNMICRNEVKTSLPVSFLRYGSYKSKVGGSRERGEFVPLVKNYLLKSVTNVDTNNEDQIRVKF